MNYVTTHAESATVPFSKLGTPLSLLKELLRCYWISLWRYVFVSVVQCKDSLLGR